MTKTVEITCNGCGRNLTYSGNSVDWRLSLNNEHIPSVGGFVTDMMISRKIKADAHFCDIGCLRTWLDREHTPDMARAVRRWHLPEEERMKPYKSGPNSHVHPGRYG